MPPPSRWSTRPSLPTTLCGSPKRWVRRWSISTPRPSPSSPRTWAAAIPTGAPRPPPQNPGDDDQEDDQQQQQGQGQGNFQDFFNRFFGGQIPDQEGGDDGQVRESLGSGFIVDPKGYIITNNHVIEKADKIYVKLSTDPDSQDLGRPARVIGVDKATDLAVIKIDTSTPLPTVKLGNSDTAQVGDWVEAIGSPFALSQTVTAGIISAKNRTIEPGASGQFQHFIQTDAAINPGNSGGPLLNMNGEVIGVNTAIYTQSAGYQGIGFAMPSNTVVEVYNDLISPSHKVTRGSIGIRFQPGPLRRRQSRLRLQERRPGPAGQSRRTGRQGRPQGRRHHHHHRRPQHQGRRRSGQRDHQPPPRLNGAPRLPARRQADGYHRHHRRPGQASLPIPEPSRPKQDPTTRAMPAKPNWASWFARSPTPPSPSCTVPGVVIQSVRSGSFADLQGLEPGLIITRINKQPTGTKEQFDAVVSKLKTGRRCGL